MPTRILREGILTSPRVNSLSFGAELFYRRLMTVADDYGRYHASPATLRGACWPICPDKVTEKQITGWINECLATDTQLLSVYESGGYKYLQIANFGQQVRGKSKFPDPSPAEQLLSNGLANDKQMCSLVVVEGVVEGVVVLPKKASAEKTSRFSGEPTIPDEWASYPETKFGWNLDRAQREYEKFGDYWRGTGKRMVDWLATWRNWCRNANDRKPSRHDDTPSLYPEVRMKDGYTEYRYPGKTEWTR